MSGDLEYGPIVIGTKDGPLNLDVLLNLKNFGPLCDYSTANEATSV